MAAYRLGDMVRMRREALGLTQSELIQIYDGREAESDSDISAGTYSPVRQWQDEIAALSRKRRDHCEDAGGKRQNQDNEICSVQVLRRIERGEVARAKMDVYRRLMLKMGVLPERTYASILVTKSRALRLKSEIHVHMNREEYQEAEQKLEELETMMVPGYPRNEQYRMERRATLAYRKREITAQAYLETLQKALQYTVPKLEKIDIAEWPFNMNEFDILIGIANAYHDMKAREEELAFLLKLKQNMERRYMNDDYYVAWHVSVLAGLSQLMCLTGQHEKSLEYCEVGIEESKKQRILGEVYHFQYDIAWNREQLMKKQNSAEAAAEKERELSRQQLVRGYYLSLAQGDMPEAARIKRLYERNYPDAVGLL